MSRCATAAASARRNTSASRMDAGEPVLVVGQRAADRARARCDRLRAGRSSSIGHLIDAVFTGDDGSGLHAPGVGACWPFITHKFGQFMYGRYPEPERWRVNLTYAARARRPRAADDPARAGQAVDCRSICSPSFRSSATCWCTAACSASPHVPTELWGGLLVTLVVASVGIAGVVPARHPPGARAALAACRSCAGPRSASSSSCAACR